MKRNLSFKWFAFMLLAFLSANTYAQTVTCQPNMDFGLGNFTNWNYYEGTFIGSGSNPGVLVDTMHVFPPSTQTVKRFTVESGATTDLYGGFPIADPTRTYSLKIGFDTINYCVNKARFQVHVPAGTNDYALIYRYAIVMEDPGHIASQQPRFLVKTTDSTTGTPLACGNFTYVAGSLPGFNLSSTTVSGTPVYYKSWATASLNLSGFAGKTVTVDFEAIDCALGGHFGYGYFDMTCGLFEIAINNCNLGGNTTVSAPPGFQTYQWYDSSYTTVFSTADTTTFATPTSSKTYHVICTPFSGYGCPDTLTTRINISNLTIHASNDTTICSGASVSLSANASGGAVPLSYIWNPSAFLSCTTCATTIASPTTSESYVITVSDSFNCHRADTINVTVNHIANVTSDPTNTTSCQNTSASFTAAASGTPTPTVQWQVSTNGGSSWSNISGATSNTYSFTCTASQNNNKYRAIYSNTCGNDTSAAATLSVNLVPVVTTDPAANTSACVGATASFTAASSGTPTPTVQWQQSTNGGSSWSNISGATSNTYSFTAASGQNSNQYRAIYTNTCGSDTSGVSTLTVNPNLTPAVSISGTSTICAGTPVTFTATPTNGGAAPSYQWKKNGNNVGTNSTTYTDNALAQADAITCVLTSNATCATPTTATSAAITMTVNPLLTPSVAVTMDQPANICAGTVVTFTATPTNGGSSPSYQWLKNSLPVGTNSNTYSDGSLVTNDIVSCTMTSNATCRTGNTAPSNSVTFNVNPIVTPSISISGTNNICAGTSVTFTASISNGGSSPVYQWKKNGVNVGTNSNTYTNASLSNGDVITCVLTSNVACATSNTATSNAITMTVNPVLTPSVSIGAVPGTSVFNNTSVTFTATPANGGASPSYQWKKNGVNVGTNSPTYTDNSFTNGDVIACIVTSDAVCVSPATATGSVTMTVTNRPPLANPDANTTTGNTAVSGNVSTNDSDPDGNLNASSYTLVCGVCTTTPNGALTLNNNGTYTYTPNNGFTGTDHFIYQVCDNGTPSLCDTAIVTINVTNRPPLALPDVNATAGNTAVSGNVSTNDTDPDGNLNTSSYTLVCGVCTTTSNGSLTLNNNGTYTYTPNNGFTGTDHFIYQVCDNGNPSLCDTAIVTINVSNRPPLANPDANTTNGNTAVTGNVATNDTDPDGNLNTSSYTLVCGVCTTTSNGTLVLNNNGTYTYTPNNGFTGTDHFIYQVCDNGTPSLCDTAIVTINVTNRPPVALPDFNSTSGNTAVSGNVSTNDTDPDGNLNASSYTLVCGVCTTTSNGSLTLNNNGTYTYTPNNGFTGTDHFIYQVCDNGNPSLCDTALVSITINNRPPVANPDVNTTNGNTAVSGNVSTNDTDPDGNLNTSSYTLVCGVCTTASNGTLVLNNNGTYTYTPNSGFTGTDHFIYQVCDNGNPAMCDTAIVTLNVINRAPVANPYANTTNGNTAVSGNVSTNDTDPDGNLNTSSYTLVCGVCTTTSNGTLVLNNNGTYTYTPNSGFTGTDHFIYQVCDNGNPSLCDTAIVTLNVTNRPPLANDDIISTHGNTAVSGNVGTNDTDPDGNLNTNSFTLSCGVCAPASNGTVVLNSNGTYTYTPNNGFAGTDHFIYQVCDNGNPSLCDTAIATVTVDPIPAVVISAAPGTTICAGTPVTFTAVPTNGGSAPSYQWKKNNVNVGTNSATYTELTLNNGDVITCVMTSNLLNAFPASVTSNTITMTVNALPVAPAAFTTSSAITYDGQTGVTYTVPSVAGVTYTWSYSGTGATINGSGNSVTVDFSTTATSGNLCVTATTTTNPTCGPSASRCIAITVKPYETWTCSNNNDWNNPANWDGGFVPYGTISVLIPAGTPCSPHVCSTTGNAYNVTVNSGATVDICCPYSLNVNGDLTLNGSVLGCGYLTVTGPTCHTIYGKGIVDNFELNNSCGGIINTGDTLHIVQTYNPVLGVMTVNGELELLSDSNGTAVVLTHPGTCNNYINGDVICDKYIHGGVRAFRFLGHPFTSAIGLDQLTPYMDITGQGGAANGFTPTVTNNPSAFWYNTLLGNGSSVNDSTGWIPFTNTNGAGANAWNRFEGLRLFFRGSIGQGLGCTLCVPNPITIKMHGPLNECDETVTCATNSNVGYNFIGNPYPSNIDLSLCTRGSSVGANFAVWDPNQGTEGAYVSQPFNFSYVLPSLSAFFTTCTASTNNTITFHESDKTASAASGNLFKTTSGFGNNAVQLHITSNNDSLSWDRLLFFFNGQAMANVDALDGQKMFNPGLSFYSYSADQSQLSIDVRPYVDGQVIKLGLQNASPMSYAIHVDDYDVPAGATLYLHDKYLNQVQALSHGMQYNFSVTSDANSQGDNRFELNLSGATSVNSVIAGNEFKVNMMPNPATENATISFEAEQAGNTVIRLTSVVGQVVYSKVLGEMQSGKAVLPLGDLAPGVYLVTVVCGNHSVTQRLVKQ